MAIVFNGTGDVNCRPVYTEPTGARGGPLTLEEAKAVQAVPGIGSLGDYFIEIRADAFTPEEIAIISGEKSAGSLEKIEAMNKPVWANYGVAWRMWHGHPFPEQTDNAPWEEAQEVEPA